MINDFSLLRESAPSFGPLRLWALPHTTILFFLQSSHKTAPFRFRILKRSLFLSTFLPWFIAFFPPPTPFFCPPSPAFFMYMLPLLQGVNSGRREGRREGDSYNVPTAADLTHSVLHMPPCSLRGAPTAVLLTAEHIESSWELLKAPTPRPHPRPIKSKSLWL